MSGDAGKGDTYRKVDLKKYAKNYDGIFRKSECLQVTQKSSAQNCKRIKALVPRQ